MIRNTHSIETLSTRRQSMEALFTSATSPGLQRAKFETAIAKDKMDYAVAIQYGGSIAAVDRDGNFYSKPVDHPKDGDTTQADYVHFDDVTPGVHPSFKDFTLGAAPANKRVGNVIIPCGVCAIIAGAGEGKTPLAHALAAFGVADYSVVRVGEPLAGYTDNQADAAYGLAEAVVSSSNIVLDSVKDLLASGGNLMKSGISRDLLTSLSSWSTTGCEAGATIFVPINPSVDDAEVIQMILSSSKSNATMAIVKAGSRWEYWARQGEGLARNHGFIDLSFDVNGTPSIKMESRSVSANREEINYSSKPNLASYVHVDIMTDALRRSLVPTYD